MLNADVTGGDIRTYAGDIALALSVHRGHSAALVWPENEPAGLLDGLATLAAVRMAATPPVPDRGEPGPAWEELVPAGPEAEPLAGFLGGALERAVTACYACAPPGPPGRRIAADGDLLIVPLDRGCDCGVHPPGRPDPLRMRLHKGEVLYVPQGFALTVSGRQCAAPLLALVLPPLAEGAGSPGARPAGLRSSGSRIRTPAP
ncbi:hypothetical protein [Streptomyces sp. NPDC046261]|uniref:hypothetical protein n=1 Tax=Streptomyces sp. NPDC046261 TaxID=3157200 RepID=UPI0033FA25DF